jgi:hypothetical protein
MVKITPARIKKDLKKAKKMMRKNSKKIIETIKKIDSQTFSEQRKKEQYHELIHEFIFWMYSKGLNRAEIADCLEMGAYRFELEVKISTPK